MLVNSTTRLCCLIGHPVAHSVSPQMHNAAFKALGLDYVYLAFDVEKNKLKTAVDGLRALGAAGFNVTIPHKVSIVEYLDGLDGKAEKAGTVNTVVLENDLFIGYNTDIYGIAKALEGFNLPEDKAALIIGAGGAARAAVIALLNLGFDEIILANRTVEKAYELSGWVRSMNRRASFCGLDRLGEAAGNCGLIVNATPIGMSPKTDETPLRSKDIPENAIVLDMVYNPLRTKLLKEAEKAGAKTIPGIEVLVHQGAEAFELWTGRKAPIEVMRKAALTALGGEHP